MKKSRTKRSEVANAKSVLSVLGACIKNGDEVTIICDGEDEEAALHVMVQIVEDGLGDKKDTRGGHKMNRATSNVLEYLEHSAERYPDKTAFEDEEKE